MLQELNLNDDAPWKERFRAPSIAWSQIASQNTERGLVCTNRDGIYQLYAWETETGELRQLTHQPAGVVYGVLSEDGKYVYYLHDEQGDEIGHYFRIPFEGGEAQDATPSLPAYSSMMFSQSRSGKYIGFTIANQDGFQIFVIDQETGGSPHLRYQSERLSFGPALSYNGEISVTISTERSKTMDFNIEAYDTLTGDKIGELWDGEGTSIQPSGFAPIQNDFRLLATTNQSGFKRPLIWNPKTGGRTDLHLEELEGEIFAWDWSWDAKRLLLCQLNQATYQLYTYDIGAKTLQQLKHPSGTYSAGYFTKDGTIICNYQNSTTPSSLLEINSETGEKIRTVLQAGDVPSSRGWKSVTFASTDGTPIQAWLATPEGEAPFPTIVHTHGGPTAVQTESFHASSQAWLDHGFAFFSINYRGSTTFGKDFERAIWGNLGDLEVEDVASGTQWLIDQGIAQEGEILKTGGSYGGYLTLQTLGKKPQLWAGGMAVVAIADWVLMYEDQADTLRGYQRALFGGTPEEKPEEHKKSSPLTYADDIQAELLVIQGENDTRCPSRQMKVYEEKLQSLGKSIHIHWFDAGHGSRAMEEQIEQEELKLRFAYRVLG